MDEQQESLEESFRRIQQEQAEKIEKLQKQIEERDNLIRAYMTQPGNKKPADDDGEAFTADDVRRVVETVKNKRS